MQQNTYEGISKYELFLSYVLYGSNVSLVESNNQIDECDRLKILQVEYELGMVVIGRLIVEVKYQ